MDKLRKLALDLLIEYEEMGKYVNLSLSSHKADNISGIDRAFLTSLLYTTVEHKLTYDYYISTLAKRSIDKVSKKARNILRLGMCQILDMDKVSDFTAVNETVDLASSKGERAFVNGILRALVRSKNSLPTPDKNKDYARYLSVVYSFPKDTVKLFMSVFGQEDTEKLLKTFNDKNKYTDIAVNTGKISREELIKQLLSRGIDARESFSDNTVRILGAFDVRHAYGYSEGLFFVRDTASDVAVSALGIREGDTVIDVCAAPGGKSFSAAIMTGASGKVYSFDVHESKLSLITDGAKRLGLDNIHVSAIDATLGSESLFGKADKVICDVPCSGLGILSKKPDIRYKDLKETEALPSLQYSILERSVKYLKAGGEILYSTCTLNPRENREVVERFLASHEGYALVDFEVCTLKSKDGSLTLLPHVHATDGFFIAKIRKEKD